MGRIYRQCSRVRIWLGCEATECNLYHQNRTGTQIGSDFRDPFELIRRFASGGHIHDWPDFVRSETEWTYTFQHSTAFEDVWERHMRIMDSTWWTRVWTVQETLLPNAGLVMYDTWSIPLQSITACGQWPDTHFRECCEPALSSLRVSLSGRLDAQFNTFYQLHFERKSLADGGGGGLQKYHWHFGHRQCQDPRDKVYGFLSLLDNRSASLTLHYSDSIASVFYQGTCRMMDDLYHGGLHCLIGFHYGPASHKWASWVRDFHKACTQRSLQTDSTETIVKGMFNAGGGSASSYERCYTWPFLPDEKPFQIALALTGRCVGTLSTVCQKSCPNVGDFDESEIAFTEWMQAAGIDLETHETTEQSTGTKEVFWRTIHAGVFLDAETGWRRVEQGDMWLVELFVSWIQNGKIRHPLRRVLATIPIVSARLKTYFRTQSGGHGLCYPSSKVGDQVWIIHGSKVPFILRHVHVDTEVADNVLHSHRAFDIDMNGFQIGFKEDWIPDREPAGHYQLIGDCYLDGFMDGEGLDDDKYPSQSIMLV
jgi:hypothetical protein